MTDKEIIEKTKAIYLQQPEPEKGWWYKLAEYNCLCIEGCLLNAMGWSEKDIELASKRPMGDFNSLCEMMARQPVYRKLLHAAYQVTETRDSDLFYYNDRQINMTAILDKAIENETVSNN